MASILDTAQPVSEVSSSVNMLLYGDSGTGKGHPYGTGILTPHGWKNIEDLNPGDSIIGSDGLPQTLVAVFDRGELDTYEVKFSDGTSTLTDGSHLWRVSDIGHDNEFILTTEEIAERSRPTRLSIPSVAPVEFEPEILEIEPYLLGVLLANGSLYSTPVFSTNDQEVADRAISLSPEEEIYERTPKGATARRWSITGITSRLRSIGLFDLRSKEKFIPQKYLFGSSEDRKELLSGLLDCDGSVRASNGQAMYFTRSISLARGVVTLVQSLGGIATVTSSNRYGSDDYKVSIQLEFNPFSLPRKAELWRGQKKRSWRVRRRFESVKKVESREIRCLAVSNPDRLYVTESFVVTHNTVFAGSGREKGKNDLIIDVEGGTLSAASRGSKANTISATNYDVFMDIVEAIEEEPDRFEWVIIDSLTKLQDVIWEKILEEAVAKNPSRSPFKRELQEYGEAQERLKAIVERLNNSEANILYLALADTEVDEEGNNTRIPALHGGKGKISNWVSAQMDVVAYTRVLEIQDKLTRAFHFNKTPEFYAKDRINLYPGTGVKNLTLEKFTNKILSQSETEEASKKENK